MYCAIAGYHNINALIVKESPSQLSDGNSFTVLKGFSAGQGEINIKQSTNSYQPGNQRGNKWANTS